MQLLVALSQSWVTLCLLLADNNNNNGGYGANNSEFLVHVAIACIMRPPLML